MSETAQFDTYAYPEPDGAHGTDMLALCIRVAGMIFCMDLEYVERVLTLVLLQPVPQGPDYLAGVMNLQGRNIPVIDLGTRLGLTDLPAHTADTPLIVCKHEGREIGLIVSEVFGVEPVRHEAVQMTDEFGQSHTHFWASLNTSHGLALLLDTKLTLEIDWTEQDSTPLLPFPDGEP